MIPRRAIFYWEGEEPSWLRRQSWESFARVNPDWEIAMLPRDDGLKSVIHGENRLARVLRSDLARYEALVELGGFYFDTDIIFFRPVPQEWLAGPLAMAVTSDGVPTNIAILGAEPGNKFFSQLARFARDRIALQTALGYQSLGVSLMAGINVLAIAKQLGEEMTILPTRSILTVGWAEPEKCWSPPPARFAWQPLAIGMHWFGGDHASIEYEKDATEASLAGTLIGLAYSCSFKSGSTSRPLAQSPSSS